MGFVKRVWRKYIVPGVVERQLRTSNYTSAEVSRLHAWSLRVAGQESLKLSNLSRRVERRLHNTIRLVATPQRDKKNKLIGVSFKQA